MFKIKGGHVMAIGDERLRVLEQFMAGGDLVRGFESQGFGPRDAVTGDAIGGRLFFGTTAEVNFPLFGLPPELGLSGALFADAGSLWDADSGLVNLVNANGSSVRSNDFDLRASAGMGIRWRSPFGPIKADFAWPFMKENADRTQMFRLSGGTRF